MKLIVSACLLVAVAAAYTTGDYQPTHEDVRTSSYFNQSTSSFVKIIPTKDVRDHDTIYVNPAALFIGKENGEILKCLQTEPRECEVFYTATSNVHALLITGEYVFASLFSGLILRCDLYTKGSCETFYTASSEILALSADGGYLYASLYRPSTILRCDLNQPKSCRSHLTMEKSYMWAFSHFGKYIYAAQDNGVIMRCSVRASRSCIVMYDMKSSVQGFANVGDHIYAVTSNNFLWKCSRKSDATLNCLSRSFNITEPKDIASFNAELYVANKEGVYICNWSKNGTSCSPYVYHGKTRAVAIAYETYQMQNRYKNEHNACTWQSNYNCPPFVTYYGPHERSMFEVHVTNGKLYNSQGFLVDTRNAGLRGAAIFAMGPDGRILLSNVHLRKLIHTSSLFAGNPVAGTGEMVVLNGVVMNITTCSEHYRPDLTLNRQVVQSLISQGYTDPINSQMCSEDIEDVQIVIDNVQ